MKRFASPKFILDKEYRLFPANKRSQILLLLSGENKHARVSLVPSQRARSNVVEIDFDEYLVKGASAKGKRVSTRVVRRVVESTERVIKERANSVLPGLEGERVDQADRSALPAAGETAPENMAEQQETEQPAARSEKEPGDSDE